MNQQDTTEDDAAVASFHDDPLEVVRVIAGLAAQYASMPEEVRRGQPSPVRPDSPMAQAAIRICRLHGYADDGNELPGFMERAARAELEANPTREMRALDEAMPAFGASAGITPEYIAAQKGLNANASAMLAAAGAATAAPEQQAQVRIIDIGNGKHIHREEGSSWGLFDQDGKRVRHLNIFEANFVNSALRASEGAAS